MTGVALHDWDGRIESIVGSAGFELFDTVYLTVEDAHVTWRQDNVHEALAVLKAAGKRVYLDPWGVGGLFAGETYGRSDAVPALRDWIEFANSTDAGVLIDEPKEVDLIQAYLPTLTGELKLAVQPERLFDGTELPLHQKLSVSTYNFGPNDWSRWEDRLIEWDHALAPDTEVWVQTWLVPEGRETLPAEMIRAWRERGRTVNIWSHNADATTSKIRSDGSKVIWGKIIEALR